MNLLTSHEAATLLRLSERTLERSRVSGFGPPFCKLGRRVLYRADDLDQWIAGRVVSSTSGEQMLDQRSHSND
jgi:excisionase family DNA binding protein